MSELPVDPTVQVAALQIAEGIQKNYTPDFQGTQSGIQALHQRARVIGDLAHEILRGLHDGPAGESGAGAKKG